MDIAHTIGLFFLFFGITAVAFGWFLWSITHYD